MKKLNFIITIFCFIVIHAQNEDIIEIKEVKDNSIHEEIPFAIIDEVPVHPNCKYLTTKNEKKRCFNTMLQKHVARKFNTEVGNCIEKKLVYNKKTKKEELQCIGLSPGKKRINIIFKIDKNGDIVNIKARAPHPKLKEEALRIIKLLPKMEPGKQRGKPIGVNYTLPITFNLE